MRQRTIALLIAVLGVLVACSSAEDLPPDAASLRALHAIPELDTLRMTFDGEELGDFGFAQLKGTVRPGEGRHSVAFDVLLPGDATTRLLGVELQSASRLEQTIVLTGTLDDASRVIWEQPARDWTAAAAGNTALEVSYGHAAPTQGALDLYLGAPDFDPAAATPVATLTYGDLEGAAEIESGNYVLVVTPATDPASVLFESARLTVPAGVSLMFVVIDSSDIGSGRLGVRIIGGGFSSLSDQTRSPALRMVHGARGTGALDLVIDADTDTTLFSGIAFEEVTDYAETPTGTLNFQVRLTSDAGDVRAQIDYSPVAATDNTMLVSGPAATPVLTGFVDDNRRFATEARFRILNGADGLDALDVYLVSAGVSIADRDPISANLPYRGSTGYIAVAAGSYDLILTEAGVKTEVAEPRRVTLARRGVYSAVAVDAAAAGEVELLPLDDLEATP